MAEKSRKANYFILKKRNGYTIFTEGHCCVQFDVTGDTLFFGDKRSGGGLELHWRGKAPG